jgi:quinol monooxygenase YgiN
MFVLSAELIAREGEDDAVEHAMTQVIGPSRAEPGVIQYIAHRSIEDPRRFMFYEQYVSEEAWKEHCETPHYLEWVAGHIAPRLESRHRRLYREVPPADEPG